MHLKKRQENACCFLNYRFRPVKASPKKPAEMPAVPGCLYACARRHAGTPSPWHPKVPSVPSVPFHKLAPRKKGCGYRLHTFTRKTSSCMLKTISNKKRKKLNPLLLCSRFMGARNQVLWLCEMLPEHMEEDSPSPASQLSAPSEDVPSLFPAPLMYTHTKDLQKYTHTHIYIYASKIMKSCMIIIKCFRLKYGLHEWQQTMTKNKQFSYCFKSGK